MPSFLKSRFSHKDAAYRSIKKSGYFDKNWYRATYKDIEDFDPILHYLRHGASEGRRPSANFDGALYLAENEDVRELKFNPLLHWILHGKNEGRRFPGDGSRRPRQTLVGKLIASACKYRQQRIYFQQEQEQRRKILASGLFSENWYRQTHADIGEADPAFHYIRYGAQEGRVASPHFDALLYVEKNPDVKQSSINPLLHWIEHGCNEGRLYPQKSNDSRSRESLYRYCDPDKFENPSSVSDPDFRISVITPSYNTKASYLIELYHSLINQTYSNWEWVICDDCSTDPATVAALKRLAQSDARVRLKLMNEICGISGATNVALNMANGNYVALVDHDDLLSRDIFESAWSAWKATGRDVELFYSDECKLSLTRELYDFVYKPAWSPVLLESTMYIGHLSIYRRDLVLSVGGMRSQYDGTQDYDLALRLSRGLRRVVHLPKIGYFWRAIPGSTAMSLSEKSYAVQKQREAVSAFTEEFAPTAEVDAGPFAGHWRTEYDLSLPAPLLSVVIPTGAGQRIVRGEACDLLTNCIKSLIERNFYPNMEFIVVHNGDLTVAHTSFLTEVPNLKLVHYPDPHLNLSRKMNMGVDAAAGQYVCLLNDDIETITERAGEALVAFMQAHPGVGAIGPMCLYENGTVQHNGVMLLEQGPSHCGILETETFGGPFNYLRMRREAFGVTGAILITEKRRYIDVGGFNELLPLNYNDVEFCAKINSSGLSCVVDPEVKVFHFESATKVGTFKCEKELLFRIMTSVDDHYFNINYDQSSPYFSIPNKYPNVDVSVSFERLLDDHIRRRAVNSDSNDLTFTIGISIYNQPKNFLNEMLKSILAQTYSNIEIIIHDDASTLQETKDWVESVRDHPRVNLIISDENNGIIGGQRKLLDAATGDYFLPVDADDFVTIDSVEILANAALLHPEVNVFYSDEFKSDVQSNKFSPFYKTDFDHIKIFNCCFVTHQMMFKTAFLREIGAYSDDEATWCHDWDTTFRALQHGATPMHVPELLYAWRINPGSTASAETGEKPEAVASQSFVLNRHLDSQGLRDLLLVKENKLGPNTGMWSVHARLPVRGIETLSATNLWRQTPKKRFEMLREAASVGDYVMLLLDETDPRLAELELSVPIHLDPSVKIVGSTLVDHNRMIAWTGGLFDDGKVVEPSCGLNPREGGYHGQLYCQRLTDVVAGANALVASDALHQALDELGEAIDADRLMITLAILAKKNGWLVATTPGLEATLPLQLRTILPVDRDSLLAKHEITGRSPWLGRAPLMS